MPHFVTEYFDNTNYIFGQLAIELMIQNKKANFLEILAYIYLYIKNKQI